MTLEEKREFFKQDRFAVETTGLEIISVGENTAKVKLKIEDRHLNGLGFLMGGAYFTTADFAFAVATNDDVNKVVTSSSTINYLRSVKGDELYAEAKLLKNGRSICFYQIDLTDKEGNLVAVVNTTGCRLSPL